MTRYAWGVTLTTEEKARIGIDTTAAGTTTSIQRTLVCTVSLPDGTICPVRYERYNARSHCFEFRSPINQRFHIAETLERGIQPIEEKVSSLVTKAFAQAQEEEQKRMRRKTLSSVEKSALPPHPSPLSRKVADECAGRYAVCVQQKSGILMRIGPLHEKPEEATAEIRSGAHHAIRLAPGQAILVGICNRPVRRWQEPQFLTERLHVPVSRQQSTPEPSVIEDEEAAP